MSLKRLTPDNTHLSQPNQWVGEATASGFAINCTTNIHDRVTDLLDHSVTANTRRAYRSDLDHFTAWGGTVPASPIMVAAYLAAHVDELSVATLVRRVATLSKAHETRDIKNPCRSELVRATLKGIKRTRGTAQRQAKPLLRDDLIIILDRLGGSVLDVRDRALLLIGFAGGFRRSELVGLDHVDIVSVRKGLEINIKCSKTDQEKAGRKIGIPHGRTRHCPVAALGAWLDLSETDNGPIFRPVDRHGNIHPERLSGEAVSLIVHRHVVNAGIDPVGFSGHSLRAGFATSAAQAGVSTLKIKAQTGHTSDSMLARYVRDGELFVGNAAGALL